MIARILLAVTLVTYALAVVQSARGSLAGGVFLVSEPLYWPTLAAMIAISSGVKPRAAAVAPVARLVRARPPHALPLVDGAPLVPALFLAQLGRCARAARLPPRGQSRLA